MIFRSSGLAHPGRRKPYLMAHRGNRALFPENTHSAFVRAFEDGADLLETDLQVAADDAFMCIHDATVDRTTDGTGLVANKTAQELARLNAAANRPDLPAEPIPTLAELVAWLPPDFGLALELKTDRFLEADVAARLLQLLKEYAVDDRTMILSFSQERLRAVKLADPTMPVGLISLKHVIPHGEFEMLGPFWPLLVLNPCFVRWAHRRGQFVAPLDPGPETRLGYYRWLGCDAVLSDHPHITAEKLQQFRR
jgi:glycerophosphoryl diester phosphodiesterase